MALDSKWFVVVVSDPALRENGGRSRNRGRLRDMGMAKKIDYEYDHNDNEEARGRKPTTGRSGPRRAGPLSRAVRFPATPTYRPRSPRDIPGLGR